MRSEHIWQYDESRQVGTDYESQEAIESYDQHMQNMRDIGGEIGAIFDLLDLAPEAAVLEVGTGTGEFAIAAAKRCSKVIALDVSAPMLEYAEQKARSRLPAADYARIEFAQAGFLTYRHKGAPLDAVVSQLALHHLPDFWKQVALMRISDILKEGGRLYLMDAVYSFNVRDYENFFEGYIAGIEERCGEDAPDASKAIADHVRDEYSTMSWALEGMLARAGFTVDEIDYKNGFMAAYLCTREVRGAASYATS